MSQYDAQQVCLNGHQITAHYYRSPERRKPFCDQCGAKTIHQCPDCGTDIKGHYRVEGVVVLGRGTPIPDFCHNCGKPYPWYQKQKELDTALTKKNDAGRIR